MKFRISNPSEKWHPWFAWHPVTAYANGGLSWVWLEHVQRRFDKTPADFIECWCWEYKEVS